MLPFVDRTLGRLLAITLVLAGFLSVVTAFVPQLLGFDWASPVRILQGVVVRRGFPTAVAVAFVLGRLARREQGQSGLRVVFPGLFAPGERRVPIASALVAAAVAWLAVPTYHPIDLVALALLVGASQTSPSTGLGRAAIGEAARAILLFIGASFVFTVIKAFLFVGNAPKDAAILAFETALFGDPIHHRIVAWVNARPVLAKASDEIYFMIFEHMTVASVFLVTAGRRAERIRLWSAIAIAYLLGGPAYYLLPALGPAFFEPDLYRAIGREQLLSRDTWEVLLANTNAIRAGRPIELSAYSYIACMPSLHLAHEAIMLYYARFSRPFFILTLLFTIATSFAVMALGWHYFVDIFGGLALAAVSVAIVERFGPGLPLPTEPSVALGDQMPGEQERVPLGAWLPFVVGPLVLLGPAVFTPFVLEDGARVFRPDFASSRGLGHAMVNAASSATHALEGVRSYRPLAEVVDWLALVLLREEPRAHHVVSLLLLGLSSWFVVRLLARAEVSSTARWTAAALVMLHPATVLAAGYVSARVWLVGTAIALGIVGRLVEARSRRLAVGLVALGASALGLLHEGLAFGGLALVLAIPPDDRATRMRALAGAVGILGLMTLVRRALVTPPAFVTEIHDATFAFSSALEALAGLTIETSPSPANTVGRGSPLGVAAAASALGTAVALGRPRFGATLRTRLVTVSLALPLAIAAGLAVAGANARGVSGAAAFPAIVGLVIAVTVVVDGRAARIGDSLSPALRRSARFLPALVILAGTPLAWAGLSTMRSPSGYAVSIALAHPNDGRALLLAGSVLVEGPSVAEGASACERARDFGVPQEDVTYCLALATAALGDPATAHARLADHPRLEASREVRNLYVRTLLGAGDGEGAQREAARLLALYPDDANLRRLKAAIEGGNAIPAGNDENRPSSGRPHFSASPTR